MPKVYIEPKYDDPDRGDGGIRRVVEAQKRYLPEFGWEIAANKEEADLIALHAGLWIKDVPRSRPIVSHSHGLYWDGYEWQKWHHQLNEQVIYSILHADAVTAPSEWVANALRRNFGVRPTTLYHGIEPSDWNGGAAKNGNYVLWNKARVDAICDPTPVLELARRVQSLEFVTTFAPSGVDLPKNLKVTGLVHYEEAKKYVEGAAVYLATTRETFGVGTLEALAAGVPILGWDYAGQREIVQHKVTGWLAPRGDYDSLEEGLVWCLANREQAGRFARQAIEDVWTWREAIGRYAKLYTETLIAKQIENESPRTSIIVTNYNLGKYLPETMDSLHAQTDQDFEIILIDDASTDETSRHAAVEAATLNIAGEHPLELVLHDTNVYLAESLNDGVRRAKGRYILPLDADNMISPGTLENLANRLDADRDADIAYGSVEFIEQSNGLRFISTWPPAKFDLRAQLSHKNQIPSTSLYRKQIWERVGGYRARCKTAEDADFWCRTTSFGAKPVKATDAVTLIYRNREDSMSHTQADWPWEMWYPWGTIGYERLAPPASGLHVEHSRVLAAESPVVSIVIPVGPKHTRIVFDALDSIRAQTFQGWEVIVVNDSNELLEELPSWVRVVNSAFLKSSLHGPAMARNEGMQFAGGEYFLFLDADDFLEPTALEKMVGAIHELPEKSFVYGDWVHVGNKKRVNSQEWDCAGLLRQLSYPVTALYPIEAWKASGGFDEAYTVAWEDWDFAIRIANAGYCGVRIPEVLLHYRMDTGTRREDGFARKEELKLVVFDKWKDYIQGDKKLMACGSCGQRALPRSYSASDSPSSPPEGAVLMQYNGDSEQVLVFRGLGTNKNYRFGLDPDHRTRYVDPTDVPGFLILGFTVVNDAEPAFV